MQLFSHPTIGVESHSFKLPYYILVFALKSPRVDCLEVKIISQPVVPHGESRVEYAYIPGNIYRAHTIV